MHRSYRYPTSIRLSTHMKRRLQAIADRTGRTVAAMLVFWIEQRLNREEQELGIRKKEETK